MADPLVVIVSGPPGTGKTTLGRRIAGEFRPPFLYKDGIKESLFDTLGWRDRDWSRTLGRATMELLYLWVETELAAGRWCVVVSNFHPEFGTPRFRALRARYGFTPFQIQCRTDGAVLVARYQARAVSAARHPGHVDQHNFAALEPHLRRGFYDDLDLGGSVVHLDTTDFAAIDYAALFAAIRAALDSGSPQRHGDTEN